MCVCMRTGVCVWHVKSVCVSDFCALRKIKVYFCGVCVCVFVSCVVVCVCGCVWLCVGVCVGEDACVCV